MELKGTVKKLPEIQTFASGFQKRELIILTEEQYPQPILVEFLSDKIDLLNNVKEGDSVKVGINIRGREWTNPQGEVKYFNSITAWRLEKDNSEAPVGNFSNAGQEPTVTEATIVNDDDLPF